MLWVVCLTAEKEGFLCIILVIFKWLNPSTTKITPIQGIGVIFLAEKEGFVCIFRYAKN